MTTVERRVLDTMMLEIIEHAQALNQTAIELSETAGDIEGASKYVEVANAISQSVYEIAAKIITA